MSKKPGYRQGYKDGFNSIGFEDGFKPTVCNPVVLSDQSYRNGYLAGHNEKTIMTLHQLWQLRPDLSIAEAM